MPDHLVRPSDLDACPGALRLHDAADGPLARVRLPGGLITGEQLAAVREIAETWGDGHVELTSRANLQLRGLTGAPAAALAAALRAAGLLPSDTHELVRNIAASPVPAVPDLRPVVRALDQALCADPRLAGLPGRFLFAVDSGAGDVAGPADVAALPSAILLGGRDAGLAPDDPVPALIAAAHAFLDERAAQRSTAWRLAELDDGPARVAAALGLRPGPSNAAATPLPGPAGPAPTLDPGPPGSAPPLRPGSPGAAPPLRPHLSDVPAPASRRREPIGIVAQPDGLVAAGALVPLGRLGPAQLTVLAAADHLVVTPWRGVLVTDLRPPAAESWLAEMAAAGIEAGPSSRWSGVTACAGRPGCARALADVRHDASEATRFGDGLPVHWVGCARGCGSPGGAHVRVEATGAGYRVTAPGFDRHATTAEVGESVAAARRN